MHSTEWDVKQQVYQNMEVITHQGIKVTSVFCNSGVSAPLRMRGMDSYCKAGCKRVGRVLHQDAANRAQCELATASNQQRAVWKPSETHRKIRQRRLLVNLKDQTKETAGSLATAQETSKNLFLSCFIGFQRKGKWKTNPHLHRCPTAGYWLGKRRL